MTILKKSISPLLSLILCVLATGCVTIAPLPPMVTYGGPETTPKGTSESVIALGVGSARFKGAHSGGTGGFARYKYGLSNKFDLGLDLLAISHSDKKTLTMKLASRYQLSKNFRLEGGLGAADYSDGKSLNGDFGITWGTRRVNKTWNYYSSLRFGYAKGFAGNSFASDNSPSSDTIAPVNASCLLLNIGTQGKINENMKFIYEGGYGYVFPQGYSEARIWYVSGGLLFNIGRK